MSDPSLPYAGTSGWSGSAASEERARRRDTSGKTATTQSRMLTFVALGGLRGRTIAEARERFQSEHHGTLSGALTALHKAGKVVRLTERRGRCSVYVTPQFIDGREEARSSDRNEALARAWDEGARAATADYGIGAATNPYRQEPTHD